MKSTIVVIYFTVTSLQCLEVIKKGLADPHSSQATRVSLIQRARRILQSKATATKATGKRRKKVVCDAEGTTADSAAANDTSTWGYTLHDFPNEDIVTASEVCVYVCVHVCMCACVYVHYVCTCV